jgi:hypothetical protein
MTLLREYLAKELAGKVERHGVVVWDDPDAAYTAVTAEIVPPGATLHVFDGSWYDLRHRLEHQLAGQEPPTMVVYIPAKPAEPDPLEELRAVGTKWTVKLSTLIRQALAGQITEQRAAQLGQQCSTLAEVEAAVAGGSASLDARLVSLIGEASPVSVAAAILGGANDADIADRGLDQVVRSTLETSLGGGYGALTGTELRRATFRQMVLAHVFDACGFVPEPLEPSLGVTTAAHRKVAVEVIRRLREREESRSAYVELAADADADLHLGVLLPWTDALESVDTTEVMEELALGEGLRRLESADLEAARRLAGTRIRSSWWTTLHAPEGATTAARWRAIDALARLGTVLSDGVPSFGALSDVVTWYETTGWTVDDAHRKTELLRVTAGFAFDDFDDLFHHARQRYESWLDQLLRATTDALDQPDVASSRLLRTVHHHDVRNGPTPTAYVLVDALRYELGVDLLDRLRSTNTRADIRSVVAAVPTITPVGMAAVLPGADTGFAIELDAKEHLTIWIGGTPVRSVKDRVQILEHAHGKVTDLKLDDVAQFANKELRKKIEGASLVLVRSTEIDADGEGDLLAASWAGFDATLSVLHTAVAKLLHAGVRKVVLTADHGFLAVRQLGEDRRIDKPTTGSGELHRRAWIGRGGTVSPSTMKIPLAAFGIGGDLEIITPRGLGVFSSGGGLQFFHGGMSPQELVVPVITVEAEEQTADPLYTVGLSVAGGRVSTGVLAVMLTMTGDLFTRESAVRLQLVREHNVVGVVVAGDGFDPETSTIKATVDVPRVVTLQVTANLVAGSRTTVEALDAATGVRLAELEVEVAANILVDDDLD